MPNKTLLLATLLLCTASSPMTARADEVLVSAAASLTDAFSEIGKVYTRSNPRTIVRFNFGASGSLQQQIANGAPVDVFASASPVEMDALQRANRIEPSTRIDFASNRLVLAAPAGSPLRRWEDLRATSVHRIALSDPESVPSGRYARDTLIRRGLWSVVQPKAVFGENVRQTLTYVAAGNVDAGIVFATDVPAEPRRVRVVEEAVPGRDHLPITYPAAAVKGAPNRSGAQRFVTFLLSPPAQAMLARYGFKRVQAAPVTSTPAKPPLAPGHPKTATKPKGP